MTRLLALLLFSLLLSPSAWAQNQSSAELEAQRVATERRLNDLQRQVRQEESALSAARDEEQASMARLESVEREIAIRQELASNYQRRLSQLNAEADEIRLSLEDLEEDIARLKRQYQGRAVHAYKYGRLHDVALIFAARSINQMLVRARYLRQFADERRGKLSEIEEAGAALAERREALETTRGRTEELLVAAEDERQTLQNLRRERSRVIRSLRQERVAIEASIEQAREDISALQERLNALAEAAARAQRARVAEDPNAAAAYTALTGSFQENEGRLPWPSSGVVTVPFGNYVNPVLGTQTPHPGIMIATQPGAAVRSVFDGEVIEIDVMPDYGRYVIIAHGAYLTVFGNFSLLYLGVGDQVQAGQIIGRAGTDAEPRGSGLFFGLFQAASGAIDPIPWLQPQ
ncbi:MAG: peptidoglycan DD-metalloendopeptidase family protein [Bacteroidota bacterium]